MKRKEQIKIYRSEQWEWTAYIGKGKKRISAVGSSETTAELNLLRKLVYGTDKIEPLLKMLSERGRFLITLGGRVSDGQSTKSIHS